MTTSAQRAASSIPQQGRVGVPRRGARAVCFPATAFAATSLDPLGNVPGPSTTASTSVQTESNPRCTPTNLPAAKVFVEALLQAGWCVSSELTAPVGTCTGRHRVGQSRSLSPTSRASWRACSPSSSRCRGHNPCAELVANAETMVFSYRVYYVMTPRPELVVVADTETAIASTRRAVGAGHPGRDQLRGRHGKTSRGTASARRI